MVGARFPKYSGLGASCRRVVSWVKAGLGTNRQPSWSSTKVRFEQETKVYKGELVTSAPPSVQFRKRYPGFGDASTGYGATSRVHPPLHQGTQPMSAGGTKVTA